MSAELGTIEVGGQWTGDEEKVFQARLILPTDLTATEIMQVQGALSLDYTEPRVIDVIEAVQKEQALLWRLWSFGEVIGLVVTKKFTANSGDEAFIWLFCGNDIMLKYEQINEFFDWVAYQYDARWVSAVTTEKVARFMKKNMDFKTHGVHVFREARNVS